MPTDATTLPPARRRAALQTLSHSRLAELTELYQLDVPDRRVAKHHIDALIRARRVDFAQLLHNLKRDELKAICHTLELDDSGRQKQLIIERILAPATTAAPDPAPAAPDPAPAPRQTALPFAATGAARKPAAPAAPPAPAARSGQVITGAIKAQVDRLWTTFWNNGISNPLSVIEQISYLLFIKRLDDLELIKERKANRLGRPMENPRFAPGQQSLRWSHFKNLADSDELLRLVRDEVFPFIKTLGGSGDRSAYARHMKDAVFLITGGALLESVVRQIDALPLDNRDVKGDLYEYMLSKLTTAGTNGQFRTPRHIIELMVTLMDPRPDDLVCDPACGTAGFLVAAAEQVRERMLASPDLRAHYNRGMFHGFDFDATMLRIGSMNMMLHGIEDPHIEARDSLSESHGHEKDRYTVVLANPPFKGSVEESSIAKDLSKVVKTGKTELLFLALFLRLLKTGGRAAVIVPDGVLFGSSTAHKAIREVLVEEHKLDGVISMPSGVFKPYAGVSTAILLFTKTGAGGTDQVWFYDMQADGLSLDDKRQPVAENDIPDIKARWAARDASRPGDRQGKAFFVGKAEIAGNGYDLSINRYKEIGYEEVAHEPPAVILDRLEALEADIARELRELRGML